MTMSDFRPEPGSRRVFLTGGSGMLGSDLNEKLRRGGCEVVSPPQVEFDLSYLPDLERLANREFGEFDWLINCAAYTAVDKAESEPMAAMKINAVGPGSLAAICNRNGWRMIHLSTDFVFDGEHDEPLTELCVTNPINVYGKSKRTGEDNAMKELPSCVVLRTAWLYGPHGKCFPKTIIEAARAGQSLRVVDDQTGSPTSTLELSSVIEKCLQANLSGGVYHAAGPNALTWHDFAVQVLEAAGESLPIEPIATSSWPTPARRPRYSVLSSEKLELLGIGPMKNTKEALAEFCQRLLSYED